MSSIAAGLTSCFEAPRLTWIASSGERYHAEGIQTIGR